MLSQEQLTDNAKEVLTAKTECTAGEKGVLHRGTVNETMLYKILDTASMYTLTTMTKYTAEQPGRGIIVC